MAEDDKQRTGFLSRLFGRGPEREPEREQAPPAPAPEPAPQPPEKKSWWRRLRDGLSRSSSAIGQGITDIFTKRKLDATTLEELEDVLVRADLGVSASQRVAEAVGRGRYDREIDPAEVRAVLADE